MTRSSLRDLHLHTSAIVAQAAKGEVFVIEKRGVPVAELRPLSEPAPPRPFPDRRALLAKFPKVKGDSGRFLEEDR